MSSWSRHVISAPVIYFSDVNRRVPWFLEISTSEASNEKKYQCYDFDKRRMGTVTAEA